MRKVLFWILIIVFLFLVVVLGVAYYNDKTPLSVLKGWFGVEDNAYVRDINPLSNESEEKKEVDVNEEIKDTVKAEGGVQSTTTGHTSNALSKEDKEAARKLIDGLIVK